jgi:hypothetical protein
LIGPIPQILKNFAALEDRKVLSEAVIITIISKEKLNLKQNGAPTFGGGAENVSTLLP